MIVLKKDKGSVFELLGDFPLKNIGTLHLTPKKKKQSETIESVSYTPLNLGYQEKSKSSSDNNADNLKARYFGIATHYCLEMMKTFDVESLEKAILIVKNKFANSLDEIELDDVFKRVEHLVNNVEFQSIVKDSNFTKEQALMFNDEHKIIDLLIQNEDGYIVVDYKTTNEKSSSHLKQVQNYVQAIKDITKENNVKGYLVYLHRNDVELLSI
jgi:exodeoxyribonuclease V beta subunit